METKANLGPAAGPDQSRAVVLATARADAEAAVADKVGAKVWPDDAEGPLYLELVVGARTRQWSRNSETAPP